VTEVEYDLDGEKVTASVTHFQPDSKEYVLQSIVNRGMSEESMLRASAKCAEIVPQIETGKLVNTQAAEVPK
jgi:hypothetical protein